MFNLFKKELYYLNPRTWVNIISCLAYICNSYDIQRFIDKNWPRVILQDKEIYWDRKCLIIQTYSDNFHTVGSHYWHSTLPVMLPCFEPGYEIIVYKPPPSRQWSEKWKYRHELWKISHLCPVDVPLTSSNLCKWCGEHDSCWEMLNNRILCLYVGYDTCEDSHLTETLPCDQKGRILSVRIAMNGRELSL